MAAANLVVKMLLDSGAFNTNIKNAQSQIQRFENAGKSVMSGIGKMATALGVATTAYELFQTAINSSVNGTKNFQTAMDVAKTSVNQFFYSLTSGNFSTFRMGLDMIIEKARETKEALLDVQYSQMAGGYKVAELRAEYDTYSQKAKDPRLSKEERLMYAQKQEEVIVKLEDYTNKQIEMLTNAILQSSSKGILFSKDDITMDMLEDLFTKVSLQGRSGVLEEYEEKLREYENILSELGGVRFTKQEFDEFISGYQKWTTLGLGNKLEEYLDMLFADTGVMEFSGMVGNRIYEMFATKKLSQKEIDSINKITADYIPYALGESLLNAKSTEELQTIINFMQQIGALNSQIATWKQGTNENAGLFINGTGSQQTTSQKQETIFSTDSVAGLRAQIAEAKKVRDAIDAVRDPWGFVAANMEVEQLEARLASILKMIETPDNKIELPDFEAMGNDLKFDMKPIIEDTTDWTEQLHNVATILSSISNMTNEGAAAWLTWGANALSSIAVMIPAVEALFQANAKNATAEAASSAAKTPVVGWITAIAAIAAMAAAFAGMPKFANGGIVSSPYGSGDRVLARVNGGEMILNKRQQSNLFNLLDNGGTASNSNVRFKIEGKDLVGVLTNYNNRINKLR